MPTENLPKAAPPAPNGARPPDAPPTGPTSDRNGSRLLAWCVGASILINLMFGFLLNYADIYGTQRTAAEQHRMKIQVYRPPIKHKKPPPPPPPKPKPPPPKPTPKIAPKIAPKVPPKVPPKVVRVAPKPPPPHTPPPPQHFTVGTHSTSQAAVPVERAAPVTPAQPARPVNPENTTVRPTPPTPTPPPPPQPQPVEQPKPKPVEQPKPQPVEQPKPKPVEQPKPKPPAIPDRDTPAAAGGVFADIDIPSDMDMSTITTSRITATFTVDARGHVSDIHFDPRSTGNHDLDEKVREAIRANHYLPAVHNGVPVSDQMSHVYTITID